MLILLSPAKSLDWSPPDLDLPTTTPELKKDIGVLIRRSKRLKPKQLRQLMGISESLASLNYDRFQAMTEDFDADRDRPAALAFDGDVYKGLDARSLSEDDLAWAQEHLAILSGLYGVLRPLDLMQPYRLEMGTPLKTRRGSSLYDFWGDRVTRELNKRLAGQEPVVVNLASNEYFRVVHNKKLRARLITPVFKERLDDGKLMVISFYAKHARGAMARYAIEERLEDPEGLMRFTGGDYRYQEDLSDDDTWVFTRPKPPPVNG